MDQVRIVSNSGVEDDGIPESNHQDLDIEMTDASVQRGHNVGAGAAASYTAYYPLFADWDTTPSVTAPSEHDSQRGDVALPPSQPRITRGTTTKTRSMFDLSGLCNDDGIAR